MILLYAVVFGLIVGLLTGGRLSGLGAVRMRFWQVALVGLLFQLALFSSPLARVVGDLGPLLYVGSTIVVLAALLTNVRLPGFPLIVAGALLNLAVILVNGGQMPASPDALAALTGVAAVPTTDFSNSVLAVPGTPLWFLGDVFVLPRPFPFANVFSFGDVLIGVGGGYFIVRTMHRPLAAARPRTTLAHG
jgi:hypothetical protein